MLSPDALTGMEASLRFPGDETLETKVFGRLSAWQNWVFVRPERDGRTRRAQTFRQRFQTPIRLGESVNDDMAIDYSGTHPEQRRIWVRIGRCNARSSIGNRSF